MTGNVYTLQVTLAAGSSSVWNSVCLHIAGHIGNGLKFSMKQCQSSHGRSHWLRVQVQYETVFVFTWQVTPGHERWQQELTMPDKEQQTRPSPGCLWPGWGTCEAGETSAPGAGALWRCAGEGEREECGLVQITLTSGGIIISVRLCVYVFL